MDICGYFAAVFLLHRLPIVEYFFPACSGIELDLPDWKHEGCRKQSCHWIHDRIHHRIPGPGAFLLHQLWDFRFCLIAVHVFVVQKEWVRFFHLSIDCADELFNDACCLCFYWVSLLSHNLFFRPTGSQNKEDEALVFLCVLPGTSADYLFIQSHLDQEYR